jgi:VWFA-related protein
MRIAVLLALASSVAAGAMQPTFRAGVDLVTFGVTVVDGRGHLITDLTAADFEVREDGALQDITHFAPGDPEGEAEAGRVRHLGLMLDGSGSMDADLTMARTAAIKFLNLLPEADDITLVDFDTEVRVTRYPQSEFARLVERIRMRKADGFTALYDARLACISMARAGVAAARCWSCTPMAWTHARTCASGRCSICSSRRT